MKEKLIRIKNALETCKERLDYLESEGVCKNYNSKIMANKGLALLDEVIAISEELYAENQALKAREKEAKRLAHNYLELDICERIYTALQEDRGLED